MPRVTYLFFGLAHVSLAVTQSYTSLEDMPAWKTLPPGASNVVIIAKSLYYAGCVTSVPQISTAACYETLPAMSSSLLSNIVSAGFWNPSVPTQFQASATSVAKAWYGQPAVKAAIGTNTPTPTSSSSPTSTSTATPAPTGFHNLSTAAQIFTILGPIVGIAGIIVAIILYRMGKLPLQRNNTRVGAQSHRNWPSDRSHEHQEGAMNTMNTNHGQGHLLPTTTSGSRNRTNNRIGDRFNIHFYGGGGETRRDETPLRQQHPRRTEPARTSDVSDDSASSSWSPITWPSRPAIAGPSSRN